MKIDVYFNKNDAFISQLSILMHPNIRYHDLSLFDAYDKQSMRVILIHSIELSYQMISNIRKIDILVPIYLITNTENQHNHPCLFNARISHDDVTYTLLLNYLNHSPETIFWDYVFKQDSILR